MLDDRPGLVSDVRAMLEERGVKFMSLNASMPDKKTLKLAMVIRKPDSLGMDKIINLTNALEEAKSMEFE